MNKNRIQMETGIYYYEFTEMSKGYTTEFTEMTKIKLIDQIKYFVRVEGTREFSFAGGNVK